MNNNPNGKPRGIKDRRTRIVESIIAKTTTDENERSMLLRFFRGHRGKPAQFWKLAAKTADQIHEQVRLLDGHEDAAYIIATDGTNTVSLASRALATQRICD